MSDIDQSDALTSNRESVIREQTARIQRMEDEVHAAYKAKSAAEAKAFSYGEVIRIERESRFEREQRYEQKIAGLTAERDELRAKCGEVLPRLHVTLDEWTEWQHSAASAYPASEAGRKTLNDILAKREGVGQGADALGAFRKERSEKERLQTRVEHLDLAWQGASDSARRSKEFVARLMPALGLVDDGSNIERCIDAAVSLSSRVAELEKGRDEAMSQVDGLKVAVANLEKGVESQDACLTADINKHVRRIRELTAERGNLEQQLIDAGPVLKNAMDERDASQAKVRELEGKLQQQRDLYELLTQDFRGADADRKGLAKRVEELEGKLREAENERDGANLWTDELNAKLAESEAARKAAEGRVTAWSKSVDDIVSYFGECAHEASHAASKCIRHSYDNGRESGAATAFEHAAKFLADYSPPAGDRQAVDSDQTRFWGNVDKSVAEVSTWPAWKRGVAVEGEPSGKAGELPASRTKEDLAVELHAAMCEANLPAGDKAPEDHWMSLPEFERDDWRYIAKRAAKWFGVELEQGKKPPSNNTFAGLPDATEDAIEAAFWKFDERAKRTGVQRDAFKWTVRGLLLEGNSSKISNGSNAPASKADDAPKYDREKVLKRLNEQLWRPKIDLRTTDLGELSVETIFDIAEAVCDAKGVGRG
jgi:hypothetical protein